MAAGGVCDGGTTPPPPQLQSCHDHGGWGGTQGVPGPSRSYARFRGQYGQLNVDNDLDQDDLNFLSHHLAPGTTSGYACVWAKFARFCSERNVDPFTCRPSIIVKYVRSIFQLGASYNTINHTRSAISNLHQGYGNLSAGQHTLVKQACKATFRLLPRYRNTFDIQPVLTYVKQVLGNYAMLPLKFLT